MSDSEKLPEYHHINLDHISGKSSGHFDGAYSGYTVATATRKENGKRRDIQEVTDITCYDLAYTFLNQSFPEKLYEGQLKNFCHRIAAVFNMIQESDYDAPMITEEWANDAK